MSANDTQTTSNGFLNHDTEYVLKTALEATSNASTIARSIIVASTAGDTNLVEKLAKMIVLQMNDVSNDLDVLTEHLGLA